MDVRQIYEEMRQNGENCDTILLAQDDFEHTGKEFLVHRNCMGSSSDYFRTMYKTWRTKPDQYQRVAIPGVSTEMLGKIVEFAYIGKTIITNENAKELLITADQFLVESLVENCRDFMVEQLTPQNSLLTLRLANTYYIPGLIQQCTKFIMCNFDSVYQNSPEFGELEVEELVEMLKNDNLNVKDETIVWQAACRWMEANAMERRKHAPTLLKTVRMGLLSKLYLRNLKKHPFISRSAPCKPILRQVSEMQNLASNLAGQDDFEAYIMRPRIPKAILLAIGGWSGGTPTNKIEAYDYCADRWMTIFPTDPLGPRAYHGCVYAEPEVYLIGGFDGVEYYNSCRAFNVVTQTWRHAGNMNSKRCYVSVALLNGTIYAMGGYDGIHRTNTAEKYDMDNNQWTYITPMNHQRSDGWATVVDQRIFITGGFDGTTCLDSAEYYDSLNNEWTLVTPFSMRRSGVRCVTYNNRLVVMGGFNGVQRLQTVEVYDEGRNTWTFMPEMLNARSNFAVEVINDEIYAIGGFNGHTTVAQVESFNGQSNAWTHKAGMSLFRSALDVCAISNLTNVHDYLNVNRRPARIIESRRLRSRNVSIHQIAEDMDVDGH